MAVTKRYIGMSYLSQKNKQIIEGMCQRENNLWG